METSDSTFVKYEQCWQSPFVIGEAELRSLSNLLSGFADLSQIEAKCSDRNTRHFLSIDDLIGFKNTREQGINALRMKYAQSDGSNKGYIEFGNDGEVNYMPAHVSITLSGRESDVRKIRLSFEKDINSFKPRYWLFCRRDFNGKLLTAIWAVSVFVSFLFMYRIAARLIYPEELSNVFYFNLIVYLSFIWWFLLWVTKFPQKFLFPTDTFCIGDGLKRRIDRDDTRKRFLWALGVLILGSSGLSLLFKSLMSLLG